MSAEPTKIKFAVAIMQEKWRKISGHWNGEEELIMTVVHAETKADAIKKATELCRKEGFKIKISNAIEII